MLKKPAVGTGDMKGARSKAGFTRYVTVYRGLQPLNSDETLLGGVLRPVKILRLLISILQLLTLKLHVKGICYSLSGAGNDFFNLQVLCL